MIANRVNSVHFNYTQSGLDRISSTLSATSTGCIFSVFVFIKSLIANNIHIVLQGTLQ